MTVETFDALSTGSGPACVQTLRRDYEIRVSQRLGARLVALARRHIRFSLALLETAEPGSELERLLLDEAWLELDGAEATRRLLPSHGRPVIENGAVDVVTPEEIDESASPAVTALAVSHAAPELAPTRHRPPASSAWPTADGPWDAHRLHESAVAFFDAEEPGELIEKLRMLFRAANASRLDPIPLLITALQRDKKPLAVEVGTLVRHHLDRDTGRALEDLRSDDETRVRDAIALLMATPEEAALAPLVLPALTPVIRNARALRYILQTLGHATPLVGSDADVVEPFFEALLDQLNELEAPERFTLSRFFAAVQARCPALPAFLFRRMRATVDAQQQAFYGNVLARLTLDAAERERLSHVLVELFVRHGHDVALGERLKITFLHLGARPLELLTERAISETGSEHGILANEMQRSYVVDLWATYLSSDTPHPPVTTLAVLLARELAARNRAALLTMIRCAAQTDGKVNLLRLDALVDRLNAHDALRARIITVLLEEVLHLEDPDDVAVLAFLSRLGRNAVEAAFERARDEAALDSRAAPYRFRIFAWMAAHVEQSAWLLEITQVALSWPFLRRLDLPVTIRGLGLICTVAGIPEEDLRDILDRLLPGPHEDLAFADVRVHAALDIYQARACPDVVRQMLEEKLEAVVAEPSPPRPLLLAALDGLDRMMEPSARPGAPCRVESISLTLARVVLRKSRETSLDRVMTDMLRDDAEGHGVRMLEAWSKDERDHALVIIGKVARHPAVDESLHRMLTARLAGFLDDWLDAHERGNNLYLNRDTPLWRVLAEVVEARPSEYAVEALVRVGLRALEVQRHAAAHLALDRREDVQRFIAQLIWLAPQEPVEVRGSLMLDIPRTAVQTLMNLVTRDSESALRLLGEIRTDSRLPERLRAPLEGFLAFQQPRGVRP